MAHLELGSEVVSITLNGDSRRIPTGSTVASLLESLALDARLVVVERNREILRNRDAFADIEIQTADTIEIVHFVGGG